MTNNIAPVRSIWEDDTFSDIDFAIVGAGVSGLWVGCELKQKFPDANILILERGLLGSMGASSRNAGFACFGSSTELLSDEKELGEDRVLEIAEMRYRGIQKIRCNFKDSEIGYEAVGGYECIDATTHPLSELEERVADLNKKFKPITKVDRTFTWVTEELKTFGLKKFDGLIKNPFEGALHSGKLLQALTAKAESLGIKILYSINVNSFREVQNKVRLDINDGTLSIVARKMIVCNNAFIPELLPNFKIKPARGQIILTEEIPGLSLRGTFHFDEGFYYFRNVGNRILLGGARNKDTGAEETTAFDVSPKIQTELDLFLKEHFNVKTEPYKWMRWSGIMGFTPSKRPVIENPYASVYALACCNGMGIALAPIMAEQLVKKF